MKKNKTIPVFDDDCCELPESPEELFSWINEKLDFIPVEFKDAARVSIEAEESYGSSQLCVTVSYTRLETDNEEAAREGTEAIQESNRESRELRELARLKKKYEA